MKTVMHTHVQILNSLLCLMDMYTAFTIIRSLLWRSLSYVIATKIVPSKICIVSMSLINLQISNFYFYLDLADVEKLSSFKNKDLVHVIRYIYACMHACQLGGTYLLQWSLMNKMQGKYCMGSWRLSIHIGAPHCSGQCTSLQTSHCLKIHT